MLKRGAWTDDYVCLTWPDDLKARIDDPRLLVPPTWTADDIHVVVAGGSGHFCALCPGWGGLGGLAVTRPVRHHAARS